MCEIWPQIDWSIIMEAVENWWLGIWLWRNNQQRELISFDWRHTHRNKGQNKKDWLKQLCAVTTIWRASNYRVAKIHPIHTLSNHYAGIK